MMAGLKLATHQEHEQERCINPMKSIAPNRMFQNRRSTLPTVLLLAAASVAVLAELPRLKVSENQRFLVQEDGQPFFWLGDTAWELFHRLNREEADRYLEDRAEKGFTVIQAVALAEIDGHSVPNPYGHLPLIDQDPARPATQDGEDYWDHVDYIVEKANSLGLYIGFLPTWGRYWHDTVKDGRPLFTVQNAETYGEWLGWRYRNHHLIWILGGDRTIENDEQLEIIRAMARGLRKGDGGAHLRTFHPRGGQGSAEKFHEDDWLDFNMRQNGHIAKFNEGYQNTRVDYNRFPVKPVLDGEPIYEDHPVSFRANDLGHSISADVRRPLYWNLFTGAFGHTYGHHSVWQMWQPDRRPINNPLMPWFEAIDQPGAGQMQYGRRLMESRPFLTRVPDDSILVAHRPDKGTMEAQKKVAVGTDLTHVVYTRNEAGHAMLYVNGTVVQSANVSGDASAWQDDFRLALGNELTEDRPWLGSFHRVAIYPRVLPASEITRAAQASSEKVPSGALVLYEFLERTGTIVRDTAGTGAPLNLEINNPAAVLWLKGGGLRINGPVLIASPGPATKLIEAVKKSNAITLEAWVQPENTVQAGPARIVSVSRDAGVRNLTFGQNALAYEVRFRTTATSPNGEPALASHGAELSPTVPSAVPGAGRYRFVATRDNDRTYAMVYAPVGRSFTVRMNAIAGPEVAAWWFNPRDGSATSIGTFDNEGEREFTPPDHGEMTDWVLVLDDAAKKYPTPGASPLGRTTR
jgi:hypothetical protein